MSSNRTPVIPDDTPAPLCREEADTPTWRCDRCGRQILGDTGIVSISYQEIERQAGIRARWMAAHPGPAIDAADLVTYPAPSRWRVLHDACRIEDLDYWVATGDLRTWRDVAGWTAHLLGKSWFPTTDWDELLRRAGAR